MSILDQALPASETVESVNALVYGDSGSGKTTFAGSGRDNGKNDLILAIEHGTASTARAGSQVNVLPIKSWDDLVSAVDALVDDPGRFEWVIVDSLTKMQDLIWEHIIKEATDRSPNRSAFKKELQEYGEAQLRFTSIVERLNGSDVNVIYTALAELHTDEEANDFQMPSIHGQQGRLAAWTCAQVDVLCYLKVAKSPKGTEYRRFQFNKTTDVFAKDRFQLFPKPAPNLTLEEFTDKLLEGNATEAKESDEKNESA